MKWQQKKKKDTPLKASLVDSIKWFPTSVLGLGNQARCCLYDCPHQIICGPLAPLPLSLDRALHVRQDTRQQGTIRTRACSCLEREFRPTYLVSMGPSTGCW